MDFHKKTLQNIHQSTLNYEIDKKNFILNNLENQAKIKEKSKSIDHTKNVKSIIFDENEKDNSYIINQQANRIDKIDNLTFNQKLLLVCSVNVYKSLKNIKLGLEKLDNHFNKSNIKLPESNFEKLFTCETDKIVVKTENNSCKKVNKYLYNFTNDFKARYREDHRVAQKL